MVLGAVILPALGARSPACPLAALAPPRQAEEGEQVQVVDEEEDVTVRAVEYNCWADVTESGGAPGWGRVPSAGGGCGSRGCQCVCVCVGHYHLAFIVTPRVLPSHACPAAPPHPPPPDHKPVYAILEANLPVTDQAKKRAVCSRLLKECAAAAARGDDGGDDAAAVDAGAGGQVPAGDPPCCLLPNHVKLHPTTIPSQMVLLRNEGHRPLLFSVACAPEECGSGGATVLGRAIRDGHAAAAAAHQLLEVRPVRGVVPPGQDVQLQVRQAEGGGPLSVRGSGGGPTLVLGPAGWA